MGFWISFADASGNRIAGSEVQLSPAPTEVDYPTTPAGSNLETADGVVIQQQPVKDARQRTWYWNGYPAWMPAYQALWTLLEPLRSRARKAAGAATPYVYVKDTESQELRRLDLVTGTVTAGGASTLTDGGKAWTPHVYQTGYTVEIVDGTGKGQTRAVTDNTATQLTVTPSWGTQPSTDSKYALRGSVSDWFKVRVLEVSRAIRKGGGNVKYDSKLVFVIEDAAWNNLG